MLRIVEDIRRAPAGISSPAQRLLGVSRGTKQQQPQTDNQCTRAGHGAALYTTLRSKKSFWSGVAVPRGTRGKSVTYRQPIFQTSRSKPAKQKGSDGKSKALPRVTVAKPLSEKAKALD